MVAAGGLVQSNNCAELEHTLANLAERIRKQDRKRRMIGGMLRQLKRHINLMRVENLEAEGALESNFSKNVEQKGLASFTVVGVDGGVFAQQLHGLDLILVRAVAAVFHYREGELVTAEYYPSEAPMPRLISVTEPLDARSLELLISMERQLVELKLAAQTLRASNADLLLLDGSILPQYVDRFPHSPRVVKLHRKLLRAFSELYGVCMKSETLLAGAVKDSRSARFIDILKQKILPSLAEGRKLRFTEASTFSRNLDILDNSRDTVLLDHVLDVGERSFIFRYAENPSNFIPKDIGELARRVYAFYLKIVPYDRPLRIEFMEGGEMPSLTADRVASLIYALSAHHDAFGLPSVLMEADACARLTEDDVDIVRDSIADRVGPSVLLELRRHRKPF